ncbi:Dual specificity protein phosphatase 15, partial [Ophiophagus hannah]
MISPTSSPFTSPRSPSFRLAGISRSTTIVLAYLMAVTQLGWLEALEAVKAVRPVANPNLGFRRQLEEFGHSRSVQKVRHKAL